MENRKHPRFESHTAAKLITAEGVSYPCHIADFSQDGFRIYWSDDLSVKLLKKDTLYISLLLEEIPTNIAVTCLFTDKNSAGFELTQPNPDLFLKLQQLNQNNRNEGVLSVEKRRYYKDLFQNKVKKSSQDIITQWYNHLLEALFTEANQALNNKEQQSLFSAEKKIKDNRKKIQHGFLNYIAQQLIRWLEHKPALSSEKKSYNPQNNDLSLVQQEDFEDWLLAKVTSTHLQSRLSHASFEVRQLLDVISEAKPENCFNPISANIVTEAFRLAIEPLELEHKAHQLAFDSFEEAAGQQLSEVYRWLIKQIDVPLAFRNRRRSLTKQPSTHQPTPNKEQLLPDAEQPKTSQAIKQVSPPSTNELTSPEHNTSVLSEFHQHQLEAQQAYSNIQNLLAMRQQRIEAGIPNAQLGADLDEPAKPSSPVAEHSQVQSALQQLWQTSNTEAGRVRQDLEQELAKQAVSLPSANREAIDTLEHVTQDLVGNKHVSDFIKPFIAELEQPLSMMMLNDPSIMFNPHHPGRIALNSLSTLGRMTTTGQEQLSDQLTQLLANIKSDASPESLEQQFQQLQDGIDSLLVEAQRRAKMNADRVAQAAAGEHRVERAKLSINRLTNKDTSGKTLPSVVIDWLQQGWKPLLILLLLREGVDSKRFRGAVKLYRQVLSVFNPANSGRGELLGRFKALTKLMRSELDQFNGQQPNHMQWHDELNAIAAQHLESGAIEKVIEVPIDVEEKPKSLSGKGYQKASNLQVGDWLLLVEQDLNVSVVWMADDGSKFACVNHSGMKVVDFTLEQLAEALENGSVKRLYQQEESAVDQSLDALVQQIYSDLSEQANTDALTQINTRQRFMRHLKDEAAKSHLSNLTHTLCLIDIDQFKLINSEYGVEGGDECLKSLANVLRKFSDNQADYARMGSNEFAILFQHTDLMNGEDKAHSLKNQLEKMDITIADNTFRIHVSMGISELNFQVKNENDLVEFAESACLLAKEKGGSRVYRYIENDDDRIKRDGFMSWANKLNQALEGDKLQILCLPVTAVQDTEKGLHQYEIIISIEDKSGSQIPPLEYLQSAENYSRMHLVNRWTLEKLIEWMRNSPQVIASIDRFMLKLSGYSMNDDSLLKFVSDQAYKHNVPVNKLCFELNETTAIKNINDAADFMHTMRKLGCEFTLSDFGTGQSSFGYLKQLPVNYVKIDKSFISELVTSSADYAMVKSIHEIAHFMAKKIIAEQVNDQETLDILRSIGIDLAMGGDINQAVPLEALI